MRYGIYQVFQQENQDGSYDEEEQSSSKLDQIQNWQQDQIQRQEKTLEKNQDRLLSNFTAGRPVERRTRLNSSLVFTRSQSSRLLKVESPLVPATQTFYLKCSEPSRFFHFEPNDLKKHAFFCFIFSPIKFQIIFTKGPPAT